MAKTTNSGQKQSLHKQFTISAILSADDLNDFISPGVACIKPIETLPVATVHIFLVSPQFAKKTTLARHRLVNSTLKEEIAAIHAWTPKCHTPEEWEEKKPQAPSMAAGYIDRDEDGEISDGLGNRMHEWS
jgi:hypothetical protein